MIKMRGTKIVLWRDTMTYSLRTKRILTSDENTMEGNIQLLAM
jgi:hypothetical protein